MHLGRVAFPRKARIQSSQPRLRQSQILEGKKMERLGRRQDKNDKERDDGREIGPPKTEARRAERPRTPAEKEATGRPEDQSLGG